MRPVKIFFLMIFILLLNMNPALSKGNVYEGTGYADLTCYPEDVAHEIALRNAKRRVAEQAGEIKVYAETVNSMGTTVKAFTDISLTAIVKDYKVVKTWKEGKFLNVKIHAAAIESKSDFFKNNLSDHNVVVLHKGTGSRKVFDKFCEDLLRTKDINIYTVESLNNYLPQEDIQLLRMGEIPYNSTKFLSFLVSSVILIDTSVIETTDKLYGDKIKSFHGRCSIKRFKFKSNRYLLADQVNKQVKFFGLKLEFILDDEDCNSFYGRLIDSEEGSLKANIIEIFRNKFLKSIKKSSRTITISIKNIPDRKKLNHLIFWLKKLPYIDPKTVSTSFNAAKKKGEVEIDYTEKSIYLASMIDRIKGVEVVDYDYQTLNLIYRRK